MVMPHLHASKVLSPESHVSRKNSKNSLASAVANVLCDETGDRDAWAKITTHAGKLRPLKFRNVVFLNLVFLTNRISYAKRTLKYQRLFVRLVTTMPFCLCPLFANIHPRRDALRFFE